MASNQTGLVQQQTITRKPYFVGFNTVGQPNPPYSLTNVDLIKRDLNNAFATPKGSRVMLPSFGTDIFNYLFDPFDEITKNTIIEDAISVVQNEPRVKLVSINVNQTDQALNVIMTLIFLPESITDNLFVSFSLTDQETF